MNEQQKSVELKIPEGYALVKLEDTVEAMAYSDHLLEAVLKGYDSCGCEACKKAQAYFDQTKRGWENG